MIIVIQLSITYMVCACVCVCVCVGGGGGGVNTQTTSHCITGYYWNEMSAHSVNCTTMPFKCIHLAYHSYFLGLKYHIHHSAEMSQVTQIYSNPTFKNV